MYNPDGLFLVVAKALISAPPLRWKGADLERRRERQDLYRTNKHACLFLSSVHTLPQVPAVHGWGVNKMAAKMALKCGTV